MTGAMTEFVHVREWSPMRFSHFFVDRPIFAGVISIILTLVGAISFRALPITEFPGHRAADHRGERDLMPARRRRSSRETVAAPIEQEINGVDNMIYVVSQATGNGVVAINVVFKPGTNIDQAQVLVQNRVSIAMPRLPEEVQRIGVTVKKSSPDLMLVIHLISPDGTLDQQYISNYATINIKDVITRVDGVGDTIVFGARDYSMRVWLDPGQGAIARPDRERRGRGACAPPTCRSRPARSTSRRRRRRAASRSRCRRSAGCRARSSSATSSSPPIRTAG